MPRRGDVVDALGNREGANYETTGLTRDELLEISTLREFGVLRYRLDGYRSCYWGDDYNRVYKAMQKEYLNNSC